MAGADTRQCPRCGEERSRDLYYDQPGKVRYCKICFRSYCAARNFNAGRTCSTCGDPIVNKSTTGYCRPCGGLARRGKVQGRHVDAAGYVVLTGRYDHPNAGVEGRVKEHIAVMSETLGRPLRPGENVHHINGVRDDNRPENLELWVRSQPSGQRAVDLVAWAREILARYEDEVAS